MEAAIPWVWDSFSWQEHYSMNQDPFARFERSRAGILIPVILFGVGAVLTTLSIAMVDRVMIREEAREMDNQAPVEPADEQPAEANEFVNSTLNHKFDEESYQ
jgi:hypothetical protein